MLASVGLLDLMWPDMTVTLISGPKPTAAALLTPQSPSPYFPKMKPLNLCSPPHGGC